MSTGDAIVQRDLVPLLLGGQGDGQLERRERCSSPIARLRSPATSTMPSWDIFEQQTQEYQDTVLPPQVTARVAVEQASTFGWERYVGRAGRMIGMHTFGASAPLKELQRKFGFEPDQVAAAAKAQLGRT